MGVRCLHYTVQVRLPYYVVPPGTYEIQARSQSVALGEARDMYMADIQKTGSRTYATHEDCDMKIVGVRRA